MGVTFAPQADPLTPQVAAKQADEETVTMTFPQNVMLTRDDHQRIFYPKGVHEVPLSLASHGYLAANGVKKYERQPELEAKPIPKLTQAHADFLVRKGYSDAKNLPWAQDFFEKLTPEQQNGFLIDFATDPDNLAKMEPLPPPPQVTTPPPAAPLARARRGQAQAEPEKPKDPEPEKQ